MEWQFRINWPAIIEEAKQRRKQQRLTQSRLATIAGVSTPTISRFENGAKDIQLSTVMSILTVLGMCDRRNLVFPLQNERYDLSRMVVIFSGKDGEKVVQCAVSEEVLVDYFAGNGKDPLKVFQASRDRIQHEARRKYLAENFERDGSILIVSKDLE